jgi:RHS repeat-associated protein
VGTTKGAFEVNPAGGASYIIPIDVLPGVNGLTPSLSLVYSSNSGSGTAGYGWQIGGISAISRTGQTIYNDGLATGVDLTGNDKFSLDGQRMVLTSGAYGADQATYQTEIDEFSRIQSQLTSGSGPGKFMVQTKSGLKNLYGSNDDGCQRINENSEVLNWYLTETSDLYGNLISYKYMRNFSRVYPAEINYGPNKITFYYKERPDVTVSYLKGQKIELRALLDKITISYNSNIVKTYQLKYNQINDSYNSYSVLNEVIESGIGNSPLNSTVFSYQTPADVNIVQSKSNSTDTYITYKSKLFPGDFNGDGKADFLCLPDVSKGATWTGMRICYGDGLDNFSSVLTLTNTINLSMLSDLQVLDINGDGKDDIIYETTFEGISDFCYLLNMGNSFSYQGAFHSAWFNDSTGLNGKTCRRNNGDEKQSANSDYNGDGVNDIFLNDQDGTWSIFSLANSTGVLTSTMNTLWSVPGDPESELPPSKNIFQSADFNGDGIPEICEMDAGGTTFYSFANNQFSWLKYYDKLTMYDLFSLGDFNADGKTDIFIYGYNKYPTISDLSDWQVHLSTGTDFEVKLIPQKKINLCNDKVSIGDFNGDGCSDLMVSPLDETWTGTNFYITKNKGTDFITHSQPNVLNKLNNCYIADFNGDGRADFALTAKDFPVWPGYQVYNSSGNTSPLLEKVADGLNNLTTITYTRLSQASASVYQNGTNTPGFPVCNFQGTLPVVSSVSANNGIGGTNSLSFYYEGAKIHGQGKGFLGFSKRSVTDISAGIITETLSDYNNTYYSPLSRSIIKKTTGGSIIETNTETWSQKVLDVTAKRILPFISSSTQTNVLTGHSVTTSISAIDIDDYGNVKKMVKTYNNGVSETTVPNYTNTINTAEWKPCRIDKTTVTYAKSGESSVSQSVEYTYNTNGIMKPDLIYYYKGTGLQYSKNHDYDSKGNLTQMNVDGASIGASQTNYSYDTNGIRILTATDVLGHVTTNTYDTYGRLETEKDYLNNINTYGYDALGRQASVSNTNGSQTTSAYVWSGTNKPALGVYGVTQTGNDGSVTTTWYDKLGRAIRSEKKGFGGQMILTDSQYNAKGQITSVTVPYFANGSIESTYYYGYDTFGRKSSYSGDGQSFTYSYSNATVSETTVGRTSSKTYGPDGTLTSATDLGGTITYSYFSDGKVKTINSPGGVTSMLYDDAARNQTQLIDPSAGTINYTYDSFGRVKTQTDARSKLTTNTYLPDGRTSNVVNPEGTTTYSYNTNKQLAGTSSPNSVSRGYGYDTNGRVTSISETIGGSVFSSSFTYDNLGRLGTRTHPSTIVETMHYNSYGYMDYISAGGSIRFTITGKNAREQLTGSTYGSTIPLLATYGFDSYGYLNTAVTGSVQNYLYSFNPAVNGNLNMRRNMKSGIMESFTYDNLDRLTNVSGPQPLTMTFNANGNISTKSDIGTTAFGYGASAGPYALTGVTSTTGIIPSATQTAAYTSFEKVSALAEGVYSASFIYNSDNQRAKMDVTQSGSTILTRWYVGSSYIKDIVAGVSKEITYIGGDAYTAPVAAVTLASGTIYYYLLRDHLGSITHVVRSTDNTYSEYSYDAWGRRRNPTDWSYNLSGQPGVFADRGFTGHEFLPWFNLVNMNGRMYDPLVGRFLNADPFIQNPGATQDYNRYSYCLNNPLKYIDPSGYILEMQDLPPDTEQLSAAGEFYRKFSGTRSIYDFSTIGGRYSPSGSLDVIGTLLNNSNGGYWSSSTGIISFDDISSVIFSGTPENRFQTLLGWDYTDGSSFYYSDGSAGQGGHNAADYVELGGDVGGPIGAGAKNILDNRGAYMPRGQIYGMNRDITVRTPLGGINTTSKALNYVRVGGKIVVVAGVLATGYQVGNDISNGNYASAGARAAVMGIAAGAAFIPVVGWGIAAGIGVADFVWGDQFYNYLSTNKNP